MNRYPHLLTVLQSAEASQDSNGNWTEPESYEVVGLACREEPGGGAVRLQVVDGVVVEFSSMIYMPVDTPALPNGIRIQITDSDGVRMEGTIKRFVRDRKHCRIWA